MSVTERYGIVILAAGNSSRLGQPKQLLQFHHRTLLHHTIDAAVKTTGKQVIVVTGAHKDAVEQELGKLPVHVIYNEYWQQGMASSIYTGLITLLKIFPHIDNVIFSVCDQPFISAVIFKAMIKKQRETGKGIIAAFYKDTAGVPVLFNCKYVHDLIDLEGRQGAKTLLQAFKDDVETVPFPKGEVDIDTAKDLVLIKD